MPHIHKLIDFTVSVFIVRNDKVLLRFHDKYNFWDASASGHVELDETPDEAVIREAKEEVGLDIEIYETDKAGYSDNERVKKLIAPTYMNIHKINDAHRHIGMVYFATTVSENVRPENNEDRSDNWKWVTAAELEKMDMWEDLKFYAAKALGILAPKS